MPHGKMQPTTAALFVIGCLLLSFQTASAHASGQRSLAAAEPEMVRPRTAAALLELEAAAEASTEEAELAADVLFESLVPGLLAAAHKHDVATIMYGRRHKIKHSRHSHKHKDDPSGSWDGWDTTGSSQVNQRKGEDHPSGKGDWATYPGTKGPPDSTYGQQPDDQYPGQPAEAAPFSYKPGGSPQDYQEPQKKKRQVEYDKPGSGDVYDGGRGSTDSTKQQAESKGGSGAAPGASEEDAAVLGSLSAFKARRPIPNTGAKANSPSLPARPSVSNKGSMSDRYPGSYHGALPGPYTGSKNLCRQVLLEEEEVEVLFTPHKDRATVTTLLGTCSNPNHPLPTLGGGCVVECENVEDLVNITPLNSHVFVSPANFKSLDNYYPVMCSYRADAPLMGNCNIVMKVACCSDVPRMPSSSSFAIASAPHDASASTSDATTEGDNSQADETKAGPNGLKTGVQGSAEEDSEQYYVVVRSKLLRIPLPEAYDGPDQQPR